MHEVYKITFCDGAEYVGMTRVGIEKRLYQHRKNPCNLGVHRRLAKGESFKVEILSRHRKPALAVAREKVEISKLSQPLNYYIGGYKMRIVEERLDERSMFARKKNCRRGARPTIRCSVPRPGSYVCSICRVSKNHTEYAKDRCRFNGLSSRCKECYNIVKKREKEVGWVTAVEERKKQTAEISLRERYAR